GPDGSRCPAAMPSGRVALHHGIAERVAKGASHGIGHVLGGTAGVPHGYTSCIMLPPVRRFNAATNADRQGWVSEALGAPGQTAGDAVAALVASLGLPGRLRDVGVTGDQLDRIAEAIDARPLGSHQSAQDRWAGDRPRAFGCSVVKANIRDRAHVLTCLADPTPYKPWVAGTVRVDGPPVLLLRK
ncbi:MAG: iron-containing alcohol dehydrogenase, partial [Pseudomonadota bacterium]|nr:iron-containing alcohol dehydrogenase [Pseudomonadota bacterium]